MLRGLKFLPIFVGFLVDIGGSFFVGVLFGFALFIFHAAQGMPTRDIVAQMDSKHIQQLLILMSASLGLGSFCSLLGGFVVGWMARVSQVKNGFVMGLFSTAFGSFFWASNPLWYNVICPVFTVGATMSGAYFAQVLFGKGPTPPPPPAG
jgi:hypothetical protein